MKLFNIKISFQTNDDIFVVAKNEHEAELTIKKAVANGYIEPSTNYNELNINSCEEIKLSNDVILETKNDGLLYKNSLIYGPDVNPIIQELNQYAKKQEKEEYLKKHHMEFKF